MTRSFSFLLLCAAVTLACRGADTASPDPRHPLARPADDPEPAHVFTPRPHRPRQHPMPPAPPDLRTLPVLVDDSATCFGRDPRESGPYQPTPRPKKTGKKRKQKVAKRPGRGRGYVPYGQGDSKGSAPSGLGRGSAGTRGAGGAPSAQEPAAPVSTPAPADPAPASDRSPRGKKKRPSRKRPKKADKRNAPSSVADDGDAYEAVDEIVEREERSDRPVDAYHGWGASIYLSNDDTMSLSSAQRVMFAIDEFLPLPLEHIRPHELLNYFSFDTRPVAATDDFSVHAGIDPDPDQAGIYSLALAVRGRPLGKAGRRNTDLAFVVDRSGSMSAEGRMEYLKRGLLRSIAEMKDGDIVHVVLFDHAVCSPIRNFVVGRDPTSILQRVISRIQPRGSTDVHAGLRTGYDVVDRSYRPTYSNRVVLVTDALANTGVTNPEMIAMIGKYYDNRRIRLSGVGVGREFNDALLDRLTERGKGAYVFLGSSAEVDAVFGARFTSLIETTANDVHFQLHLPPSLRMNVFYGEESSVVKEDVQAIHYFANTSQLFLADVMARDGRMREQDQVMLTIEYEHSESGEHLLEEYAFSLGELRESNRNARKGRAIMRFIDGLAWMASRPPTARTGRQPGTWVDEGAWRECEVGREDLRRLSSGLEHDRELERVRGLWDRYCSRYERPRNPVQRRDDAAPDAWPGARG